MVESKEFESKKCFGEVKETPSLDMRGERFPAKLRTATFHERLRRRIIASVVAMVLLALLGSTSSLYQITEVNRVLESIHYISVPLSRLFTQIELNASVLHREFDRGMGYSHWKDPHWAPKLPPQWIKETLESELGQVKNLLQNTD